MCKSCGIGTTSSSTSSSSSIIMAAPPAVLSPAARLPVELVEMICNELARLCQRKYRAGSSTCQMLRRLRDMMSVALVCRLWREPAQLALLRSLHFETAEECADFLHAVEDAPQLLEVPRVLTFNFSSRRRLERKPFLDMPGYVAVLLEMCRNVELVYVYAECDAESSTFERAVANLQHLRTFIFESIPVIGQSNSVIFELPSSLELFEYMYTGDHPSPMLWDLDELLESDARPVQVKNIKFHAECDLVEEDDDDEDADREVSNALVESLEGRFADRGVAFELLILEWDTI
ncbi:uncharacterized protein RHOBADRAFT_46156 [Rhodotorula graminis WP1]|uniref:F-box domain-containing protein n=1 Tax=Rhodotorula graminis (strain WP1) TaxID=578459 RepID=A0A0P9EID7_RHOGW|nr:uncharacterized protein RHOBADRAFT_46156 [Rhodotorula graminis WP1]KPV73062.1 hypothetical protein RHOBADRAFT_46156 [Rhodotorula graminis WP1]